MFNFISYVRCHCPSSHDVPLGWSNLLSLWLIQGSYLLCNYIVQRPLKIRFNWNILLLSSSSICQMYLDTLVESSNDTLHFCIQQQYGKYFARIRHFWSKWYQDVAHTVQCIQNEQIGHSRQRYPSKAKNMNIYKLTKNCTKNGKYLL